MEAQEAEVQSALIDLFTVLGFEIMVTSRVTRRCRHCGRFPGGGAKGDGVTKGLPDLFVRNKRWAHPGWVGVEVKGAKTRVSPEQQALADRGLTFICRSVDDGVALAEHLKSAFDTNK